ncbi:acyltransferase family protein [Pseudomonadota bacterium]
MKTTNLNSRLNYLDAVRAFALVLGIVFHASLSFVPVFIGWAVMDISTGSSIMGFILVSHSFRMELFFLIAGFFSHMTFHRKGASNFVGSRLMRIAIPLVAGWFILKPLIISSWVMGGESMRGDVNVVNGLKIGFQSLGQFPRDFLTGTHLWFLYYLLLITAIVLVIRALVSLVPGFYAFTTHWADRIVAWIANSRFSWLALSFPTAACLWYMNNWGMDTPDKSLVPQVPVLLVYCGFFSFGWLLHRQKELIEKFSRITWGGVALCIASVGVTFVLSAFEGDTGHPELGLIRAGFALSYAIMMWSLVTLSIGLFKRFFDKPSKFVQYIADASYWLYLIHLPIVIWLQIAFAELPFHWSLKLIAVSLLTIGISLALYDLLVRSTLIGKMLNGRTKERVLFRRNDIRLISGYIRGQFTYIRGQFT